MAQTYAVFSFLRTILDFCDLKSVDWDGVTIYFVLVFIKYVSRDLSTIVKKKGDKTLCIPFQCKYLLIAILLSVEINNTFRN